MNEDERSVVFVLVWATDVEVVGVGAGVVEVDVEDDEDFEDEEVDEEEVDEDVLEIVEEVDDEVGVGGLLVLVEGDGLLVGVGLPLSAVLGVEANGLPL